MASSKPNRIAIWAITPNGQKLADKLSQDLAAANVYISQNIAGKPLENLTFQSLSEIIKDKFHRYTGHIFIMSTGIVVRVIAPLIRNKTEDPAVVVVDDRGKHAVSLLSGHLGGANKLTLKAAEIIGANPVITTATDVNNVPAIDVLAGERNLFIENPPAIKTVNMALLKNEKIFLHDPYELLRNSLPNYESWSYKGSPADMKIDYEKIPGIFIDDINVSLPAEVLILRPKSLAAGIGCNRNTGTKEMKALLADVFEMYNLSWACLKCIASIDVKADESGLIALAENLSIPLLLFNRQELNQAENIKNPSSVVEKYVGVKSVCEAAAILAAKGGTLIVPKKITKNVTLAIARINYSS